IKIDRSFVTGASDPEGRNAALIRAMVGLASDLKMQTTAEGVETQDELLLVRNLGVSLVQGYIFGKPMPAEEARELAVKGAATVRRRGEAGRVRPIAGPITSVSFPHPGGQIACISTFPSRCTAGASSPARLGSSSSAC